MSTAISPAANATVAARAAVVVPAAVIVVIAWRKKPKMGKKMLNQVKITLFGCY